MKVGTKYYLKKYHRPLMTNHKDGDEMVVEVIANGMVFGNFISDSMMNFNMCCMKHEFSKIFRSKK